VINLVNCRYGREEVNLCGGCLFWIPACAGMTGGGGLCGEEFILDSRFRGNDGG
jgi:hypothetical protein